MSTEWDLPVVTSVHALSTIPTLGSSLRLGACSPLLPMSSATWHTTGLLPQHFIVELAKNWMDLTGNLSASKADLVVMSDNVQKSSFIRSVVFHCNQHGICLVMRMKETDEQMIWSEWGSRNCYSIGGSDRRCWG